MKYSRKSTNLVKPVTTLNLRRWWEIIGCPHKKDPLYYGEENIIE